MPDQLRKKFRPYLSSVLETGTARDCDRQSPQANAASHGQREPALDDRYQHSS